MAKALEIARGDSSQPPYVFAAYMRGYVLVAAGDQAGAKEIWAKGVRYGEALLARKREPDEPRSARDSIRKDGRHSSGTGKRGAIFGGRSSASCAFILCGPSRALMGLRREALDTLKAAVENGFFNLPMIEFLTRPGMSFHILRNDPDFHAIRADLARRIDALRSRY